MLKYTSKFSLKSKKDPQDSDGRSEFISSVGRVWVRTSKRGVELNPSWQLRKIITAGAKANFYEKLHETNKANVRYIL